MQGKAKLEQKGRDVKAEAIKLSAPNEIELTLIEKSVVPNSFLGFKEKEAKKELFEINAGSSIVQPQNIQAGLEKKGQGNENQGKDDSKRKLESKSLKVVSELREDLSESYSVAMFLDERHIHRLF